MRWCKDNLIHYVLVEHQDITWMLLCKSFDCVGWSNFGFVGLILLDMFSLFIEMKMIDSLCDLHVALGLLKSRSIYLFHVFFCFCFLFFVFTFLLQISSFTYSQLKNIQLVILSLYWFFQFVLLSSVNYNMYFYWLLIQFTPSQLSNRILSFIFWELPQQ